MCMNTAYRATTIYSAQNCFAKQIHLQWTCSHRRIDSRRIPTMASLFAPMHAARSCGILNRLLLQQMTATAGAARQLASSSTSGAPTTGTAGSATVIPASGLRRGPRIPLPTNWLSQRMGAGDNAASPGDCSPKPQLHPHVL
jgi:hypothetical protein